MARNIRTCSVDGCNGITGVPGTARGLCGKHYLRAQKYGDPLAISRTSPGEKIRWIAEHVSYTGDDCLKWPFPSPKAGRNAGRSKVQVNGHETHAARIMCEKAHGPAPTDRHEAAHSCGNGHEGCLNPRHLRWATSSENKLDMHKHGTHPTVKLTEADVRKIRASGETNEILARQFGVSPGTIRHARNGRTWAWLE